MSSIFFSVLVVAIVIASILLTPTNARALRALLDQTIGEE